MIRLTILMTHPVQYLAPWFRYVARECPEIELTVVYATEPTPRQQGAGFDAEFEWDVPLRDGYRSVVVRSARPEDDLRSAAFRGLDVQEIGPALLRTDPDVVLVPGWYSVTHVRALRACRRAGIPLLYRGDSVLQSSARGWRRIARNARARYFLHQYDCWLSVGARAREFLRRLGVPQSRIFSSPHCIDNEYFAAAAGPHQSPEGRRAARAAWGIDDEAFVPLFVGKIEPQKRPLDLIRAVAGSPGTELLMVGAGPDLEACRSEAGRLGVHAAWAGFLNQSELGRAYAAADCLVLPSERETWGLVVNEAMATGLPCIVSDGVGCAADMVTPGVTGEIYSMGDVPALANSLESVRRRIRGGHDWRTACRDRADSHSFSRATAGLLSSCQEAVRRRSRLQRAGMRRRIAEEQRGKSARPVRALAVCDGMVVIYGLERMLFEVLRVIREHNGAVHCLVNDWENALVVEQVERIGGTWSATWSRHRFRRGSRDPRMWLRLAAGIARTSRDLAKSSYRFRPSIILVPDLRSALVNYPALLLQRAAGASVVFYVQNAPPPGAFYSRLFARLATGVVDRFVACSNYVKEGLVAHGVPPERIVTIYNVSPTRAGQPGGGHADRPDPSKIIYVGQIIPEKGLDLLLDAVGLLVQRGFDARLDVVGCIDGWTAPEYREWREKIVLRAASADLAGRIRFLGFREDVPGLMSSAAVHCIPSRPEMLEGLPLVVVEAKQNGVPTVCFDVGPFREIIEHDVDGWICPTVDAAALANALSLPLADSIRRQRAAEAARRSAVRFGRELFARRWLDVLGNTRLDADPADGTVDLATADAPAPAL